MLQFADTLKYENKNGIVDCFDDDKYIDPEWMRSVNADAILLARFENEVFYHDTPVNVVLSISNFLPQPYIKGDLKVSVNGKEVWTGKNIALAGGLQKLADVRLRFPNSGKAEKMELAAEFTAPGQTLKNAWNFWLYPADTDPRPAGNGTQRSCIGRTDQGTSWGKGRFSCADRYPD